MSRTRRLADPTGDGDEPRIVRPYTVTGGRTRATGGELPLEALVETVDPSGQSAAAVTLERRRIVELCTAQLLSVAEVSAHLRLPLGVVRVLLGDLASAGLVRVHRTGSAAAAVGSVDQLKVLESVLNGISQL